MAQKLRQTHFPISLAQRPAASSPITACKKNSTPSTRQKEPAANRPPSAPANASAWRPADPLSVERGVRQLLADKVSGNLAGLVACLVPEHLRLGTWDLLRTWSGDPAGQTLAPRLGLHLVHEAALCRPSLRHSAPCGIRALNWRPGCRFCPPIAPFTSCWKPTRSTRAQQLQIRLGQLRRASGPFPAQVLALDPHRLVSYSKRDMVARRPSASQPASKQAQSFFLPGRQNLSAALPNPRQQRSNHCHGHRATAANGSSHPRLHRWVRPAHRRRCRAL